MTEEEIKNKISEHKECCKKLAEEYRQRYNEDNTNKLALNMFYHNVISYNDFETILATIEDRNSMIMCFSAPPVLTEETVEINLKRIEYLEKENAELKDDNKVMADNYSKMEQKFYDNLTKAKELLAKWVELFKPKLDDFPKPPIQVYTEQFLNSEVEK
jgi:hypothetical protein